MFTIFLPWSGGLSLKCSSHPRDIQPPVSLATETQKLLDSMEQLPVKGTAIVKVVNPKRRIWKTVLPPSEVELYFAPITMAAPAGPTRPPVEKLPVTVTCGSRLYHPCHRKRPAC
jgi:hypothetical protein